MINKFVIFFSFLSVSSDLFSLNRIAHLLPIPVFTFTFSPLSFCLSKETSSFVSFSYPLAAWDPSVQGAGSKKFYVVDKDKEVDDDMDKEADEEGEKRVDEEVDREVDEEVDREVDGELDKEVDEELD